MLNCSRSEHRLSWAKSMPLRANLLPTYIFYHLCRRSQPEARARKLLAGLGFSETMMNTETKKLSGGWRMRVSLVCALFAEPDLLLLDEPTNHLDLEAVIWLTNYLDTQFKGTLLVVSHDRAFLNRVITDVVHFYRGALTVYRGNVDSFETVQDDNIKKLKRQHEVQEKNRAHMQKYIDEHAKPHENGVKASRQRKSRMKKMERLGVLAASEGKGKVKISYGDDISEVEEYKEDAPVVISMPDPGPLDHEIVQLDRVSFSYVNKETNQRNDLFDDVDFSIDIKTKCAILGRNGCGKSTLINALTGMKALARASNTPGRTQEINYFTAGDDHYLVDLPGYGYANAPLPIVEKWQRLLKQYLSGRQTLRRAFVLIDARHGVKKVDEEIMSLLDSSAVTFQCVLTKADKVKEVEREKILDQVRAALAKHPAAYPEIVVTSSEKGWGIPTLRAIIATLE